MQAGTAEDAGVDHGLGAGEGQGHHEVDHGHPHEEVFLGVGKGGEVEAITVARNYCLASW